MKKGIIINTFIYDTPLMRIPIRFDKSKNEFFCEIGNDILTEKLYDKLIRNLTSYLKDSLKSEWKHIIYIGIESRREIWGIELDEFFLTKINDEWRKLTIYEKKNYENDEYLNCSTKYYFLDGKKPIDLNSFPFQINDEHYYVEYNEYLWNALLDIQDKHRKLKDKLIKLFNNKDNFNILTNKYKNQLKGENDD